MLHELLLALNGHHGNIFSLQGDRIKASPSLPLFHPSELAVLNDLLAVGTHAWKLEQFIRRHRDHQADQGKVLADDLALKASIHDNATSLKGQQRHHLRGLYVEALCEGLEQVLQPYRRALVDLEKQALASGNIQLTHVQHRVKPFEPVLSALNNLVEDLYVPRAHGCVILDVIYRASCSGVPRVHDAMKKLFHEGNRVLYKQLLAWILQGGSLYDPFDEFFIAPAADSADPAAPNKSQVLMNPVDTDGASSHFQTKSRGYRLRAEMVPGHITVKLAEKIFFIGESIQLFESDKRMEAHGAVLRERENEFYQELAELREQPEFRLSDFERFVDRIRDAASRHLHALVLESADLRAELDTARSFFLLGRGELFQNFIQAADVYLRKPPISTTQHDVSQTFLSTCRSVLRENDDEAVTKKISVVVDPAIFEKDKKRTVGWDCVGLQYVVPWPLHLILSEKNLGVYNSIFRFLVTVRRTQIALHNVWADEIDKSHRDTSPNLYSSQLRNHMMFVLDNLQQYFMADVLESQCSILVRKVDQSTDFEDLRLAHDNFLASVLAHTFVNNAPVHGCLSDLLQTCLKFCQLVSAVEFEADAHPPPELTSLGLSFSRQSVLLFQLLTSLQSRQAGSHLAQLLLRIDFNRYFSKHGHDIGKIT